MHERESQNVIVRRATNEAATRQTTTQRVAAGLARVAPTAPQVGSNVLRAGVQNIEDAVLGN